MKLPLLLIKRMNCVTDYFHIHAEGLGGTWDLGAMQGWINPIRAGC
jgi:hypothetical protein